MTALHPVQFLLTEEIPHFLIKEVLAKLAYLDEAVRSAQISSDGRTVTLNLVEPVAPDAARVLQGRLEHLVASMSRGVFEPTLRTVDEMVYGGSPPEHDPIEELLATRQVFAEGQGFFALGPLLSTVVDLFERRLIEVARALGASEYRFPALIPVEYMEKVKYFTNFPHSLTFATHLRENLSEIERFSATAQTSDSKILADASFYAPVPAMLSPTVCHHLYLSLADTKLPAGGVVATACGHCFRYEARNMMSLERLWNFTMREVIFVGSEEQVRLRLAEAQTHVRKILAEFELSHKLMTATDPFFIGTFRDQVAYQAAFELKYEIRAALPFKKDTLAIGSYNRHGDFFGRTLNILLEDGTPAHTGCLGIGFERMAYAFISQYSADVSKWPTFVRNSIARMRRPDAF